MVLEKHKYLERVDRDDYKHKNGRILLLLSKTNVCFIEMT